MKSGSAGAAPGRAAEILADTAAIGAPASNVAGCLICGVLVGVSPSDPITLSAVALGLLLVRS